MSELTEAASQCGNKMLAKYLARLDIKDVNKTMGETGLLPRRHACLYESDTLLCYVHARARAGLWEEKAKEYSALFDLLVEKGADIACARLLRSCITENDLPLFERIIATGRLEEWALDHALKDAAESSRVEMVRILLDCGANPNHCYNSIYSKVALDKARGAEVIRLLVSRGADVSFRYGSGESLLESYDCGPEKAVLLLELSPDPAALLNSRDPRSGKTLLYKKLKEFSFDALHALETGKHGRCKWSSEDEDCYEYRLKSTKEDLQARLALLRYFVRMGADPLIRSNKGKNCRDLGPQVCAFLD